MTSTPSHRPRRLIAAVAFGALVLSGCSGEPGEKRVALDVIETMTTGPNPITAEQQDCMVEKIEQDYTDDDLAAIGGADENLALDFSEPTFENQGTEDFRAFVEDLRSCINGESGSTATTTASTGETATTGETGSTSGETGTTGPATTATATTTG